MTLYANDPGSGVKDVAKLSWPIMLSMASYTVIDVTDTLMVSWLGSVELAAIGIATTVLFLIKAFFLGLFEGVKILAAQALGSRKEEEAWSIGFNGLYMALPCAVILFGFGFFGQEVFALFGGPADIRAVALRYFDIAIFASMLWFFSLALTNFYQGIGDTKTPMYINLAICLLNIIIDPIFIYGCGPIPALGVEGSALATVLVTAIGSIVLVTVFLRQSPTNKKIDSKKIGDIIRIGWPSGVRWFCDIAGYTAFAAIVARLGGAALAANQIGVKLVSLAILPGWGIAEATCILTGHHFGAKQFVEVRRTFLSGLKITTVLTLSLGLMFILGKNVLLSFLNLEEEVLTLAGNLIIVVALFQFLESMQTTCSLALAGTGDTRFPMISSILSSWFVMLPLAYFLGIACKFGLLGMWWAAVVHLTLLFIAVWLRFLSKARKKVNSTYEIPLAGNFGSIGSARSNCSLS